MLSFLRKNLLIELLLHDCIYDNEDCLKEIINIFKKESFDYLLFYLFLYDKTKDEKYLSLFKNGILDKTYLLGLNSRDFYKSNDKAYKIYDKCLKITKDAKKEKLLIKSLKINHPLIHHQLGSFYFEKGDMEKAKLYYLKGYVYGYSPCCRALARYYHEIKDIDKEIHYLIELLRYDEKYKKTDEVCSEPIKLDRRNTERDYGFLL